MISLFVKGKSKKETKQWKPLIRLPNHQCFKYLSRLFFTKCHLNRRQFTGLLFVIFFLLCLLVGVMFTLEIKKKSKPMHVPIPFVIQKPGPIQIQKIDHPASNSEMAQEEFERIIERLYQGGENPSSARVRVAIVGLKRVLRQLPVYPSAREILATLLIKQGNLMEASGVIQTGLLQDPSYLPYLKLKLYVLVEKGDIEQAAALLQDIPASGLEGDLDYLSLTAQIYLERGQYQPAVEIYRELLTFNKHNPSWLMGLGVALENLGRLREAISTYKLAQATANTKLKEYIEQRIQALQ